MAKARINSIEAKFSRSHKQMILIGRVAPVCKMDGFNDHLYRLNNNATVNEEIFSIDKEYGKFTSHSWQIVGPRSYRYNSSEE